MKVESKSRAEKYAEKWFADNGYNFRCVNRCKSKATFRVEKDGFSKTWVLLRDSKGMAFVMKMFKEWFETERSFEAKKG